MGRYSIFIVGGIVIILLAGSLLYWASGAAPVPVAAAATLEHVAADGDLEPIRIVPRSTGLNSEKVALGDRLFHDRRLSANDTISCAHCHELNKGGMDRLPRSVGLNGARGDVNAPTVFNSSLNFKQFWDGRAATLEEQIDGPIHATAEMNANWPDIVTKLRNDPAVVDAFARLYPEGIQSSSIKDAIATYERSLLTPNSRFDRYLQGDGEAITAEELEGYHLFKAYGCVACHQGAGVGGNMFATFGVMADYFAVHESISHADLGRFNVTGKESDRHRFKVPSLRNVALTAPYFHDGSAPDLATAVNIMAQYQLGRQLPHTDTERIVKFLETLSGEFNGVPLK